MLLHPAASCHGGLIASARLPGVLHGCRDWMQTASDSWKREVASSEAPTSRAAGGRCVCSPDRALLASLWGPSAFGQCPTISSSARARSRAGISHSQPASSLSLPRELPGPSSHWFLLGWSPLCQHCCGQMCPCCRSIQAASLAGRWEGKGADPPGLKPCALVWLSANPAKLLTFPAFPS